MIVHKEKEPGAEGINDYFSFTFPGILEHVLRGVTRKVYLK